MATNPNMDNLKRVALAAILDEFVDCSVDEACYGMATGNSFPVAMHSAVAGTAGLMTP